MPPSEWLPLLLGGAWMPSPLSSALEQRTEHCRRGRQGRKLGLQRGRCGRHACPLAAWPASVAEYSCIPRTVRWGDRDAQYSILVGQVSRRSTAGGGGSGTRFWWQVQSSGAIRHAMARHGFAGSVWDYNQINSHNNLRWAGRSSYRPGAGGWPAAAGSAPAAPAGPAPAAAAPSA